jgi:hypothetical protein
MQPEVSTTCTHKGGRSHADDLPPEASYVYASGQYCQIILNGWPIIDPPNQRHRDCVALLAVINDSGLQRLRIADVGGGTGGTLVELTRLRVKKLDPK